MPNWCNNNLLIKADNRDAAKEFKALEHKFKKRFTYSKESNHIENLFDSILPTPSEYLDNGNWYDWRVNKWGTKWDAVECYQIDRGHNDVKFTFLTAYSPPIEWLEYVAEMFPNIWIMLEYDEPGMCFRGVASGRGQIIDNYSEY